ncbi:MAG: DEAD/DEAH box helicase [Bacteroidales bacterium]
MKNKEILAAINNKLQIETLNDMQQEVLDKSSSVGNSLILSPTGSGKTLAFAILILKSLKAKGNSGKVQSLVITPTRELTIQVHNILRAIAIDYKVTACYGGHSVMDETNSLSVTPDIIISTPGRLMDHINRGNIDIYTTSTLVLDEFDKSLELGFHVEMKQILKLMPNLSRRILTSATQLSMIPDFVKFESYECFNYLSKNDNLRERLTINQVESPENDKINPLVDLLKNIPTGLTIIFSNYRESAERIYNELLKYNLPVGVYHGGLEQKDREKFLAMFNNGTYKILSTTDLGARGLDIKQIENIIHYHIPTSQENYTHRNGRTARIDNNGNIYVITSPVDKIPEYMSFDNKVTLNPDAEMAFKIDTVTIYLSAGKKEKISKGDIVGFLIKNSILESSDIGVIDIKDHYSLVALPSDKVNEALQNIEGKKIKNQRLRIGITS